MTAELQKLTKALDHIGAGLEQRSHNLLQAVLRSPHQRCVSAAIRGVDGDFGLSEQKVDQFEISAIRGLG
jgi:hypothetical protein